MDSNTAPVFNAHDTSKAASVEVSCNAKGETSIVVKSYGATADDAAAEALPVFKRLKALKASGEI